MEDFGDKYELSYLQKTNPIVKNNPVFENAIVKIQGRHEDLLNRSERDTVKIFYKSEDDDDNTPPPTAMGYAESIIFHAEDKKRKLEFKSKYRNLSYVVSTSNVCERLFSQAKLVMSSLRQSMHPDTLNMILFLKANRHLWSNALIIEDILNERSADDVAEILTDLPVVNQDDEETNTEPAY